jgi:Mn2+/Fe2+ NRAMP family transporter
LPPALGSRNPLRWLTIFGPGAVIASLTIGAGELIFSSRAGALFGYRLLWFFVLVLALKWVLVFATARHIVLTGAHPFQRWMELPGPRGWFPLVFVLLALVCFPIWVSFHAGTLGTLLASVTNTQNSFRAAAHLVWGIGLLGVAMALVYIGGYATLERVQLAIVGLMLLGVVASIVLLKPDWLELLKGLFIPQPPIYPPWINSHAEFSARPVWVETITYVGVLGGSGYDYLAYVSYLRAKNWGEAGKPVADSATLQGIARDPNHINRRWLRAVLVDSILSFAAVLIFAAVFVACGATVLGPQHKVPDGANLLTLQAEFVSPLFKWLQPIYFVGAFLAIFGTLYGTIEVAPPALRELVQAFRPGAEARLGQRLRTWAVSWAAIGGLLITAWSFLHHWTTHGKTSAGLIALLTPANLFTGVLACGVICLLALWSDYRTLPRSLRMGWPLQFLTAVAGIIFLGLGIKGYWDHSGWTSLLILAGTLAVGWILAWIIKTRTARDKTNSAES